MEIKNIWGGNAPNQIKKVWGEASALLTRYQKIWWIDLALLLGLIGLIFGIINVAHEWTGVHRPTVEIDPFSLGPSEVHFLFSLPGFNGLRAFAFLLPLPMDIGRRKITWQRKSPDPPFSTFFKAFPSLTIMPGHWCYGNGGSFFPTTKNVGFGIGTPQLSLFLPAKSGT